MIPHIDIFVNYFSETETWLISAQSYSIGIEQEEPSEKFGDTTEIQDQALAFVFAVDWAERLIAEERAGAVTILVDGNEHATFRLQKDVK